MTSGDTVIRPICIRILYYSDNNKIYGYDGGKLLEYDSKGSNGTRIDSPRISASRGCIIGFNKSYYNKNDEIFSIDSSGDEAFLLSMDDIENVEGRAFGIDDIMSNGAISNDETKIYFYDHDYGSIRKIERKK